MSARSICTNRFASWAISRSGSRFTPTCGLRCESRWSRSSATTWLQSCLIKTKTEQTLKARAMTKHSGGSSPSAAAALPLVIEVLVDRKAVDPIVLDLRGLCAATDYFIIVSGTSDAHVRGMAGHLLTAIPPRGLSPPPLAGLAHGPV